MLRFARTKIQPPRQRPGLLLSRPGLEARLGEALGTLRLVLVCAAAGYGKTSLLARCCESLPGGTALAWVSCDAGDSPQRLFECLLGALEPYDLPWRVEPEALLAGRIDGATPQARRRGLQAIADALVDALDACDVPHGVIVVDDLHRVEQPAIDEFLDLLLARFTPRWTLAITTRQEPPIALARLRAQGELAEFRLDDLRFERDEARAMLAAAGLTAADADVLFERTQGWPVALRLGLAAHAVPRRTALPAATPGAAPGPTGRPAFERAVFEFLAADVFGQLPADLLDFLLQTSVLPELSAARCAALTGDPCAARQLERIEHSAIAASTLAGTELTLRLHDLVREALERRLLREQPERLPVLCARAAAGEADPGRRIGYLLRAGDHAAAAAALRQHAPALLTDGDGAGVQRLLDRFPPAMATSSAASAALDHVRGLLAWSRWDFDGMRRAMQRAEAACRAAGDAGGVLLARAYQSIAATTPGSPLLPSSRVDPSANGAPADGIETRLIVLLADSWQALDGGDLRCIGRWLDETMDLLDSSTDASLWYRAYPVPRFNGLPGTGGALDRYVHGVLRLGGDTPSPLRAMALCQRALGELWQGRTAAAGEALQAAREDARWLDHPPNVASMLHLAGLFHAVQRGEREQALQAARQLVDAHIPQRGPWSLAGDLFQAARAAAAFDDAAALGRHIHAIESLQARVPGWIEPLLVPLHGLRAALAGDHRLAIAAWTAALADEDRTDRLGSAVEWRVRLAAAQLTAGDAAAAVAALQPAADRVAAYAGVGGVLMARAALAALAGAAADGRLGGALGRTVLDWQALAARNGAVPPLRGAIAPGDRLHMPPPAPPGGLSSREFEVLQRIAAGDSNKLIARAFELSPHTVKRHVANILDKLGLRSRGQAAAWYHDHPAD